MPLLLTKLVSALAGYALYWDKKMPPLFARIFLMAVSAGLIWLLYRMAGTLEPGSLSQLWGFASSFPGISLFAALVFANISMEAAKWRLMVSSFERISFWHSLRAVLFGVSLGLVSPNRIGDYSGRSVMLSQKHRAPGAAATLGCAIAQNIATFAAGAAACYLFASHSIPESISRQFYAAGIVSLFIAASLALAFYTAKRLIPLMRSMGMYKISRQLYRIGFMPASSPLNLVLLLSAARYSVFILQFHLLMSQVSSISFAASFACMGVVYVANTAIPSNQLVELGIRAAVPAWVLSFYGIEAHLTVAASLLLWLFNLALPAAAGLIFYKYRSALRK
jgi:hypothetical protein